jgi:uncharacterized repeat protein (TIGR03803 family)
MMVDLRQNSAARMIVRAATGVRWALIALLLTAIVAPTAHAQYNVIYNFAGGLSGLNPYDVSGLAIDHSGNLYGTTFYGGSGYGLVFKLAPVASGWIFSPLYSFQAANDGAYPYAGVTIGADGAIYGTTYQGGDGGCSGGCGTVYKVTPPASACKTAICPWNETVLYRFTGGADGANPRSAVVFDQGGNLYGSTILGGAGSGTVYQLAPTGAGWTESTVHSFGSGSDGAQPFGGLIVDITGNLYGTTMAGGDFGLGTIYQLTPSGSGWTENILYAFSGGTDGANPWAGLTFDGSGGLYGSALNGGGAPGDGGTVFELSPSGGNWILSVLHTFAGVDNGGLQPYGGVIRDSDGNLYGTTGSGGPYQGDGTVFELTPSGGGWTFTTLHGFLGGDNGLDPFDALVLDASGNLYGTATYGGTHGDGVIFQITPGAISASGARQRLGPY